MIGYCRSWRFELSLVRLSDQGQLQPPTPAPGRRLREAITVKQPPLPPSDTKGTKGTKWPPHSKHPPSPNDYTVGWICAISTEYTAARSFLEEQHSGPDHVSPNDNNDYTLGRIGKHNVVIAVLPDGEYGTASAAGVARDMLHSFPNVRIGLMVGIGGGAPNEKHDIHLGDIVVSAPRKGKSGVFQYDYGKAIQDQSFEPTGFLNQPPAALRVAVAGLETQYEGEGHQLEDAINHILERKPRLRMKYKRPDQGSDRLYSSDFVHRANTEGNCTAICGNDASNLLSRRERGKHEDNLVIHYGLIASANQLMKDARARDRLAAKMEAAGLMNHFPCLVIRGICDYSDSHKNKEWQGYAAMPAAAYAKDLLYRMPPNKVEAERRIREILSDVDENIKTMRSKLDRKQDLEILNWITPTDYESEEFKTWVTTEKQTLFCPGIPGAGKTILMSMVVNHLMMEFQAESSVGIAYIYCKFQRQEEQTVAHLLASVLKQLAESQDSLASSVRELYDNHDIRRTRPSVDELAKALHSVAAMHSRVYVVVGALDECKTIDGCREKFLTEMFNLQAKTQVNLLATSRPIQDIQTKFQGSLSLTIRATNEDVQTYLTGHMARLPSFVKDDPGLQMKIKDAIVQATDEMFLLVPLHVDALAQQPTVGNIEWALQNLPRGVDEIYGQAMARIKGQGSESRDLALNILSFVVHAKRILSSTELRHAVAFIPGLDIISSICGGLITIASQSDIVRLVHYTTKEYFRLQLNPLYDYAAHNWGHHARETSPLPQEVTKLITCQATVAAASQALMATRWYGRNSSQEVPKQMTGLHLAAFFGIKEAVHLFVQDLENLDWRASDGRTPLSWAASGGHEQGGRRYIRHPCHEAVVKLLLEKGADTEVKDKGGWTPLSWAAEQGHEAVVKLLLEKGADTEVKDKFGRTPLSWVAEGGHEAVVKLLLEKGVLRSWLNTGGRDGPHMSSVRPTRRRSVRSAAKIGKTH
ncbi:hypothetical protein B0T26DRAFT_739157 [Lasiosphaeria miniovina]|uniref:Nucleoside phosphorylase domain-containing protein n=1 Tax=Lasiosphaeria miniovina TaxID=1954250 RepID=A0AA40ATE7_9PEZI|nr:uncharacterized protein B0T26DRAFT_739157 [Lasiosphaeria miniovina]KAK0721680.1 hypothetical protein B0T26DRAFT_739157 [Lasiosphaeria miniovina]